MGEGGVTEVFLLGERIVFGVPKVPMGEKMLYRFPKFIVYVSGKICRKRSVYYKTSVNGVIFEGNYDPENQPRNTTKWGRF